MKLGDLAHGTTLVLGFGREGRALERAVLQHVPDARVEVVCDRAPSSPPRHWPLRIGGPDSVRERPARVLRSPGVPVDDPVLARWRAAGVPVTCISSVWFGERPDARVVAVTGSKGKSTTAALIAHLLASAGCRTELAGNIGRPVLDLLDADADYFVVELSSYQLVDLVGHAESGVITRLFPEHQDWHGSVEAYYAAKLRVSAMLDGGALWINGRDPVLTDAVAGLAGVRAANLPRTVHARDDGIWYRERRVLARSECPLIGRHNLDNLALALAVVESLIGDLDAGLAGLATFRPLPHRLETVAGAASRHWINDSIATTPFATAAALEAGPDRPVLIVGGLDRGADWAPVIDACRRHPVAGLVTLPDNGPAIADQLVDAGAVDCGSVRHADCMQKAVAAALALSRPGACILLSPGAPSFPRYRDFEERGERFVKAVRGLDRG